MLFQAICISLKNPELIILDNCSKIQFKSFVYDLNDSVQ